MQSSSLRSIAEHQNNGTKCFLQDRGSGVFGSNGVGGRRSRIPVLSRNSFDSQKQGWIADSALHGPQSWGV